MEVKSLIETQTIEINNLWDEELYKMPNWNIFQTSQWLHLYKEVFFPNAKLIGFIHLHKSTIIALTPLLIVKKFFLLKIAGSPLRHSLTPYMGTASYMPIGQLLEPLSEVSSQQHFHLIRLTLSEEIPTILFESKNISIRSFTTSRIDLKNSLNNIWKKMDSKHRNQVRQGEKNNLEFIDETNNPNWETYLSLRARLYERQKMKEEKGSVFLRKFFELYSKNYYRRFSICYKGKMIAGGIFLLFRDTCLYWDGVSDAEWNKLRPNNVLQWRFIQWASKQQYRVYDLGGTNTPSIAHFKRGFGGTEFSYSSIELVSPKMLRFFWKLLLELRRQRNPRLSYAKE